MEALVVTCINATILSQNGEVNYVHIGVAKYEGNGLLLHLVGIKIITAPREGSDYTTDFLTQFSQAHHMVGKFEYYSLLVTSTTLATNYM